MYNNLAQYFHSREQSWNDPKIGVNGTKPNYLQTLK